jgi:DNA-directed RNA polymerase II subunit RPB2
MDNEILWNVIDKLFKDNPYLLVDHHIRSYDDFFENGIYRIFKEKNPIVIATNYDESIDDYRNKCNIYMGTKDGSKLYFGKPVIYDDKNSHYMYPNEARLRNMTYGITIHYDLEVEFIDILQPGEMPTIVGGDETVDIYNEDGSMYEEPEEFTGADKNNVKVDKDTVVGGMPPRLERTSRNTKLYELTTALSAAIKQATEESMISRNVQKRIIMVEKVYLGKFPIMLHSKFCVLRNLHPNMRYTMGECTEDIGGYFIINGKEKTVVCQEKFADNMLYVRKFQEELDEETDEIVAKQFYSAEIRSVSENVAKPVRTLSVKMLTPHSKLVGNRYVEFTNKNIVVNIPNVRKEVPLLIVFRALGVISDKEIIELCLLDLEKYEYMMDLFIPSVHDAGGILTQKMAIHYISCLIKGKKKEHVLEILSDYFLPHIGETNYKEKAYYLGYMVFRVLSCYSGSEQPTDRDNYKYKRVELVGPLMSELFREYYNLQMKHIRVEYDKRLNLNKGLFSKDLQTLFYNYQTEIFGKRIVEEGFNKGFKGNWGASANTKRVGILQDLNRLSFNSFMSHLRKTNLPLDSSAKVVGPRLLHGSHWGFIDPIDTPDGGNIGLHKHLSMGAYITSYSTSRQHMIDWLREKVAMKYLNECTPKQINIMTKVFINGYWCGLVQEPFECVNKVKFFRRIALISITTSITYSISENTIFIYNDIGRICRPIFYKEDKLFSFERESVKNQLKSGEFTWSDLVCGFNAKKDVFQTYHNEIYELHQLYDGVNNEINPLKYDRFLTQKNIIDYIDSSESENALICLEESQKHLKNYSHLEIHESLIFGIMCNQIIYPEHNPPTRNSFSCGQTKQSCSVYSSNFVNRMDKSALVLHYGQTPLIKSRYLQYINNEKLPCGENTIVAIMCYGGYNMEDSVLINEGALKRGLFNTTYYNTYESHEEINETSDGTSHLLYANIEQNPNILGKKIGYDYSHLDEYGLIKEGTTMNDKTIMIGMVNQYDGSSMDESIGPKKGQLGVVDKVFMTEGEEGKRIAKVRVRHVRIPNLGDKMASRAGQKGTVGLVIPECDMPFTRNGMRPDIIINPHAIPSRMTVGQLIECVIGKTCAMLGGFGDCTAFLNKGNKVHSFGEVLTHNGFHSSGNEILYNGMTGEQLESEVFIGPTYYMRLKHMVKDKINYRARGPNTALTRQPLSGRANDGGLRIGEMERDAVASHGISNFLQESMMERSDKYKLAICNNSGMIAIYNPNNNLFISPMCDGPIKFVENVENNMNIENITKYGRSFSIVEIPYSLKLLIQELMTINAQMRIITEDNINQMENMCFTKNVLKISRLDSLAALKKYMNDCLERSRDEEKIAFSSSAESSPYAPKSPEYGPNESPLYAPKSPEYGPNESPPYAPKSPEYGPNESPLYAPKSPEYGPNESPLYAPKSPEYGPNESPPYAPKSPDYPPDKSPISGGGALNIGDRVNIRGGGSQLWKIHKSSPNFFTLHKDNVAQIDPDTDIKVVRKMDVFPEGQIVINPEINPHEQQNHIPLQTTSFDEPVLTPSAPPLVFKPYITVVGSNTGHLDIKAPEENTSTPMAANEPNMNIVFKEPAQMGGSVPTVVSEEKPTIENPTNITNDIVVKKLS